MLDFLGPMPALATPSTADAVFPLRVRYRQEMNGQIVHDSIHRREGWTVTYLCTVGGVVAGFGSIAMETVEPFRRRGFGSYLVQELKRCAYELGSIACDRCNPANVASRKTLQKAGLVPFAHILNGSIREEPPAAGNAKAT